MIILGVCLFFWFGFLWLTRGIMTTVGPDGPEGFAGGDNGNLLRVTARSKEWKWPSDMHTKTYSGTSTSQRDIMVLLLILFQKIFRDKKSEYPLNALWSFGHMASVFLIYLIGSNFWGQNVAVLISLLYFASFWPWQMSLWVGHLHVGTMFFLLATYFAILTVNPAWFTVQSLLFLSGVSFCCMLFASSSSPRYILPYFAAVFLARHQSAANEMGLNGFYQTIVGNEAFFISAILVLVFFAFLFAIKISYKRIITAIFDRRAWILNKLISAKKYPVDHYVSKFGERLSDIFRWSVKSLIFVLILINTIGLAYFVPIFIGFFTVVLILTLPDIKRSLTFYFNYIYISYMKPGINSGLVRYVRYGYFDKNNLPIPSNLRGGGFWWVPKIFFKMAPFHTAIYFASLISVVALNYTAGPFLDLGTFILLVLVSLSPIIWAEMTKAYQVSRSYSSGLPGFMIFIGFTSFIFKEHSYFWPVAVGLLSAIFIWNVWKFFAVIYPARMSFNRIIKVFNKLGIKEFYTYNTFYNKSFLYNIAQTPELKNLKINFISSLKEVENGWILIPSTTHKAGYMNAEELIQNGDFTDDPILNDLLETKKIADIADFKFQTVYGSDDIWLQENDISTYMDLMLRYIADKDRFRGYAWLVHSSKLKLQV